MSKTKSKTRELRVPSIMRITGWANRDEFDRMPPGVKNGVATAMQLANLQVTDKYPLIVACPHKRKGMFDFKAYANYWRC